MNHCANSDCPFLGKHRFPAEYQDGVERCSDCGSPLSAGSAPPDIARVRAPKRGLGEPRFRFSGRFALILIAFWLVTALLPVLNLWLSLPTELAAFLERPYTLFACWTLHPDPAELAQVLIGVVAYGTVLEPRLGTRGLVGFAVTSIGTAGLLQLVPPPDGLFVGSLPVGAGFGGAVLRTWPTARATFAWWEHGLAAYAAVATLLLSASLLSSPSHFLGLGTVVAGAIYAHFVLRRAAV